MANKIEIPTLSGGLNKDTAPHKLQANECAEAAEIVYRSDIWTVRDGFTHPYSATGDALNVIEVKDLMKKDSSTVLQCATPDGIFQLSGTSWTNKLNLGTTRTETDKWFLTEYLDAFFATNGVDNIYRQATAGGSYSAISWDTSTDSAGDVGRSITRANIVFPFNNRLLFFNTTDSVDGSVPYRMRWTQANTYNRSETSDFIDLDKTQGPILSAGPLMNNLIAVFKEDTVHLVQNQGNPVYAPKLEFEPGIIGPKAWTKMPNGIIFYVSPTGFYIFAGGLPQAIAEKKVTTYFFSLLNQQYRDNVYCFTDWLHREVHVIIPTASTIPTKQLVYNWQYDVWSEWTMDQWCGHYRFREQTSPTIHYGKGSGIVSLAGGSTDNGTAISTQLRTKAFSALPIDPQQGTPDYIQVNRVKVDALPNTSDVKVGQADYGRETPTFTTVTTVTDTDGYAPYGDVAPTNTRYASIEIANFTTVSEIVVEWTPSGDE